MMDVLPGALWAVALLWGLGVCAICAVNGEFTVSKRKRAHCVQPVAWSVIAMQVVSAVMCVMPYFVYVFVKDACSERGRAIYGTVWLPSALVLALMVAAQFVLMYLQASRAYRDTMDARLGAVHHQE